MRPRALAAIGIAAFAVFLVATMPARFVASLVQGRSAGGIEFLQAEGTLWHGTAKARVATPGGPFVLDHIDWRFLPARLAAGRLAFDVNVAANGIDGNAKIGRGFSDWELGSLKATVKAATLASILPLAAAWRPEGAIEIASPGLTWNDRQTRGKASAEWRDAAVSLADVRPLGTYRIEAAGEGGPARIDVSTLSGPLRIFGKGELAFPSRITFSGEARGEGDAAKSLDALLDLLGPKRPDGARSLEVRTR
jgi:general secretion pathway protein N